jgi:DNA (cytosine-5)-methyltransferase 1
MIRQLSLFEQGTTDREHSSNSACNGSVVGLFAGIGGVELGLKKSGWYTSLLCEIDPHARRVLSQNFSISENEISCDVKKLKALPNCDILVAGFPCQDLSQAGNLAGINGARSGLVGEIFRLLKDSSPKWVVLENVPFMLSLDKGRAMSLITSSFEDLGYSWAYRTLNSRAFGVPHRRERVIFVASKTEDPRGPLLNQDVGEPEIVLDWKKKAIGFYWTEGLRGIGWAVNHVPPIKCGSTISIPSPPAIWLTEHIRKGKYRFVKPSIIDAEKLQGFPKDWTLHAKYFDKNGNRKRWALVGNAVTVPVAEWIGSRLKEPEAFKSHLEKDKSNFNQKQKWPDAAWGSSDGRFAAKVSKWPIYKKAKNLHLFLESQSLCEPLSARASAGFLKRFKRGNLKAGGARDELIANLEDHISSL